MLPKKLFTSKISLLIESQLCTVHYDHGVSEMLWWCCKLSLTYPDKIDCVKYVLNKLSRLLGGLIYLFIYYRRLKPLYRCMKVSVYMFVYDVLFHALYLASSRESGLFWPECTTPSSSYRCRQLSEAAWTSHNVVIDSKRSNFYAWTYFQWCADCEKAISGSWGKWSYLTWKSSIINIQTWLTFNSNYSSDV